MKLHEELKEAANGTIRADADLLRRAAEYVEKCEGQEPVSHQFKSNGEWFLCLNESHAKNTIESGLWEVRPLYLYPSPPQSEEIAELRRQVHDRDERIAEMERQLSSSAQDDTDEPTDEMLRAAMLVHAMIPDERTFDEHQNSYRMIYKAMRSLAPAIVGMQLVPVVPTWEMILSGGNVHWDEDGFSSEEVWCAMLKAARGES